MRKIRAKDKVKVLSGKDKGKVGVVLKVLGGRLLVEGVNVVMRHTRGNPQQEKAGGIIQSERSIDASKVGILNPQTGKADRVGFKYLDKENRWVRIFKSNSEVIDE